MIVGPDFPAVFVNRFRPISASELEYFPSPAALQPTLECDRAAVMELLRVALTQTYIATSESIRIANWILDSWRGYAAVRYTDPIAYVDVSMGSECGRPSFDPDSVPILGVHGLPGGGKSALCRALGRAVPPPMTVEQEGNPPQRVRLVSAMKIAATRHFSVRDWTVEAAVQLGLDIEAFRRRKTLQERAPIVRTAFYRHGVGGILVDELQWAAGKSGAAAVVNMLLDLRLLGVPIGFFANTDLIKRIYDEPAQRAQRILAQVTTHGPLLRDDPDWVRLLAQKLRLVPEGHRVNLKAEATNLYDMVAASPRAIEKLVLLGCERSLSEKRPLEMRDLHAARQSASFAALADQISVLRSLAPVDPRRHPELCSEDAGQRAARLYRSQQARQKLESVSTLAVRGALTPSQREAADAAEAAILRRAGKLAPNVTAIGESKRRRAPKQSTEAILANSPLVRRLTESGYSPSASSPADRTEPQP